MKEKFVSFELAKTLKEKGYPQSSFYYYAEDGGICVPVYNFANKDMPEIAAPQIHEVFAWLRKDYKIHIIIDVGEDGWFFLVRCLRTLVIVDTELLGKYQCFNEAAIAGIEYVIDNLI